MKQMVVTGLSNEQDFQTGESSFILVLNKKIRIPINEDVAEVILREMYGDKIATAEPETEPEEEQNDPPPSVPGHNGWQGNASQDEDGIDQI